MTSLKYFCEEAPEYHVIAAGSLLGVAVNRKKFAFPVGKVDARTQQLLDATNHLLLDFRNEYLNIMLNQLRQEIADAKDDPVKQRQLMEQLQQIYQQRSVIAKRIGSCVR